VGFRNRFTRSKPLASRAIPINLKQHNMEWSKMGIPYNLNKPIKKISLEDKLKEISGIEVIDENTLMCVEDEHLNIYRIDLDKVKIKKKYGRNKKGDAEDLAFIGKTAYILSGKEGTVYRYGNFRKSMKNPKRSKLGLPKNCDPEGMCYDKNRKCLLIACKGSKDPGSTVREVFKFDVKKEECKKVCFTIDSNDLKSCRPGKQFNPSGIAVHPFTREIYMIGAKDIKLMVRLDMKGKKILGEEELNEHIFKQPESVAFSQNGDLFISTEAKDGKKAKIFKFSMK
jgi:hypothetical protein